MQEKNIIMVEDIDLGIDPYPINETESRLITLLLTLLKHPSGLPYKTIRLFMKNYYNNENIDSDQKKLHRDMEELVSLGFPAVYQRESNTYHVQFRSEELKLKFSAEELKTISSAIINQIPEENITRDVISLSQKIFGNNWNLYPNWTQEIPQKESVNTELDNSIETLLFCLKTKVPIKITYERKYGKPESKELDPIQLIKKNSNDFYLYAYDRVKEDCRNFLIPCIKKISKLESSFRKDHKPQSNIENLHPLMLPKNDLISIQITINHSHTFLWDNFINGLQFTLLNGKYHLTISNPSALYTFLLKYNSSIQSIEPESIRIGYIEFLNRIQKLHKLG